MPKRLSRPQAICERVKKGKQVWHKIGFLIEHSPDIRTIDDVKAWENPRLKTSKLAVSGERLYKVLRALEQTFDTKFYFCSKEQTARGIIKLLKMNGG